MSKGLTPAPARATVPTARWPAQEEAKLRRAHEFGEMAPGCGARGVGARGAGGSEPVLSENRSAKMIGALSASLSTAHGIKHPELVGVTLSDAISAQRLGSPASTRKPLAWNDAAQAMQPRDGTT